MIETHRRYVRFRCEVVCWNSLTGPKCSLDRPKFHRDHTKFCLTRSKYHIRLVPCAKNRQNRILTTSDWLTLYCINDVTAAQSPPSYDLMKASRENSVSMCTTLSPPPQLSSTKGPEKLKTRKHSMHRLDPPKDLVLGVTFTENSQSKHFDQKKKKTLKSLVKVN